MGMEKVIRVILAILAVFWRFGQPRPAAERIGREGKPLAGDRPQTSANGGDILYKYRAGWSPIPQ